jgi:hypothetical protein
MPKRSFSSTTKSGTFWVVVAALVVSLICATQARATQYNWTYGGDGHHSGSGTLTTTGATSPFTITDISGTFDGSNIAFLQDPGDCCGTTGNDNLLYSPPSTLLDGGGVAFETFASTSYQIFFNNNNINSAYSVEDINEVITFGGTFTATEQVGVPGPLPVPEPSSLGIVAVAFVWAAAFINRRRHRTGTVRCIDRRSSSPDPHLASELTLPITFSAYLHLRG